MQGRSWLVLGIAAFFGLIAVYLVNVYLSGTAEQAQQSARTIQTTRIAVARIPLEFGARVTPQNVQFIDWPIDSVPQGSFRAIAELMPGGSSHVVLRPIVAGEPILRSRLSGEGGRATLSALLGPDMRAAAIRISDVQGVAGFALPGDRVDVLLTRQLGEERITSVLLSNVRMIAVDQDANENSERPSLGRTATLEVSQDDAQKLALGGAVGSLSLVLRSARSAPNDIAYDSPMSSAELPGGAFVPPQTAQHVPSQIAPAPAQPNVIRRSLPRRGTSVEIIRGTAARQYEVRGYGGI